MKRTQQGFTLIELMIVVAIIGILAALAVPAYQDYTIRTRVGEASSMSGAARVAVDVYYSENGTLTGIPTNQASLGLSPPGSYTAEYVSSVTVQSANRGAIRVRLKPSTPKLGEAQGDVVLYTPTPRGGNLEWTVSQGGSTVPQKYLPRT
mgnify:CR=1 FL=1